MKLLVIGLDGATFRTLDPWIERGWMPALSRLIQSGTRAVLRSVVPPVTAPAWVSCFSGVNPGRHGIFNFVASGDDWSSPIPVSSQDVRVPRLWQLLNEQGLSTHVIDVPLTFPPEPLDGYMVSDLMVSGMTGARTWPPELQEDLQRTLGTQFDWAIGDGLEVSVAYLEHLERTLRAKLELDLYLMEQRPVDALFTVFQQTDVLHHYFWHVWDESHPAHRTRGGRQLLEGVEKVVRQVDRCVAGLLALTGEDTVIAVVSDHGFGPVHQKVHLNDLLNDWGYLQLEDGHQARLRLRQLAGAPSHWISALRRLDVLGLRRHLKLSQARQSLATLEKFGPKPDLKRSKAWLAHGLDPGLTLRSDWDSPAERNTLLERLKSLKAPGTDTPVVERAVWRDAVYHGPAIAGAPELVLQLAEGFVATPELTGGNGFQAPLPGQVSGFHRPEGILLLRGPGVPANHRLEDASILHVSPTLLRLLGLSHPRGWDGAPLLTGAAQPASPQSTPAPSVGPGRPPPGRPFDEQEQAAIRERLRALGYE